MEKEKDKKKEEEPPAEQSQDPEYFRKMNDLIAKSEAAAEKLEQQNTKHAEYIERMERLNVERTLGGTAEAGRAPKTDKEKEDEIVNRFLEGTGYEGTI